MCCCVPNRSIQIDRSTGRAFVEKLVDGVPTRTEVQLGARNEQYSQVLSGLSEGRCAGHSFRHRAGAAALDHVRQ